MATRSVPAAVASNPPLLVWGNPGKTFKGKANKVLSRDVMELAYEHADDGQAYKHEFDRGVTLLTVTLEGGQQAVLMYRQDGKGLWKDFR